MIKKLFLKLKYLFSSEKMTLESFLNLVYEKLKTNEVEHSYIKHQKTSSGKYFASYIIFYQGHKVTIERALNTRFIRVIVDDGKWIVFDKNLPFYETLNEMCNLVLEKKI